MASFRITGAMPLKGTLERQPPPFTPASFAAQPQDE